MISNYSGFKGRRKTTVAFVGILGPMGIRVRKGGGGGGEADVSAPWPILRGLKTMRLASEEGGKRERSAATIVPRRETLCLELDSDKRRSCEVNCSVDTDAPGPKSNVCGVPLCSNSGD